MTFLSVFEHPLIMKVSYNIDITSKTTFGVKVKSAAFAEYESTEELIDLLRSPDLPRPFFLIGGGSNLLFTKDFRGTVLHSAVRFIKRVAGESDMDEGAVTVEAGSGVVFDDFCQWAAENGLWGVENLSHIPGEVGASAVQNVGAYGVEAGDLIKTVKCIDLQTLQQVEIDAADCGYAYRYSRFKDEWKGRYAIVSVVFALSLKPSPKLDYGHLRSSVEAALATKVASDAVACSSDTSTCRGRKVADGDLSGRYGDNNSIGERYLTPMLVRDVIVSIRKQKLPEPDQTGSAGSFFKNPVVTGDVFERICSAEGEVPHYLVRQIDGSTLYKIPAAWMIERCGWKGKSLGNAAVYEKQPLVIVNATGKASAAEIVSLENAIVESVRDRFGVLLSPEVEHI